MVTSTDPSKPRSGTQLDIAKLEDAYLKFTQGACIANQNFQPQAPQHLGAYQTQVKMGLCKLHQVKQGAVYSAHEGDPPMCKMAH